MKNILNISTAIQAIQDCEVSGKAVFTPMVCLDPDARKDGDAVYHGNLNGLAWATDTRNGFISKGYRVTELIGGYQKLLPFGGKVEFECPVAKKILHKDAPQEVEYTDFRFSQYGIG